MPLIEPQTGFDAIQLGGSLMGESLSVHFDDFESGDAFPSMWGVTGGGSVVQSGASAVGHPGIATAGTGGGATNIASVRSTVPDFALASGFWLFQYLAQVPILSAVDTFICRLGITSSMTTGEPVDGVYFVYDAAVSPNWQARCSKASVRTSVVSSVPVVAGQYYRLSCSGIDATSPAVFSIDGVAIGSISTNVPTAAVRYNWQIEKTAGTNNRQLLADWFTYQYAFARFR